MSTGPTGGDRMNDFHRGPWFVDDKPAIAAGFYVRPVDPKNPPSFRTFDDNDGEFARRIVRALDAAPGLLGALKQMLATHSSVSPDESPFDLQNSEGWFEARRRAVSAIRAAEGA